MPLKGLLIPLLTVACVTGCSSGAKDGGKGKAAGKTGGAEEAGSTKGGDSGGAAETPPPAQPKRTCDAKVEGAECCDHLLGFDPAFVQETCGFESFVGERRGTTSCELHFKAKDQDKPTAFTIAEFRGLDMDQAIALHTAGFQKDITGTEIDRPGKDEVGHWSGHKSAGWAVFDGWKAPRRIAWDTRRCDRDAAEKIVQKLKTVSEPERKDAPFVEPERARPIPAGSHDGIDESLLDQYSTRELEPAPDDASLPTHAKKLVVLLLIRATHDTVEDLGTLVQQNARWGLPDRHEGRAKPVFSEDGDKGRRFLDAFRSASARFAKNATFTCPPLAPAMQEKITSGEWPMWCYYSSKDHFDLMVFKLRMKDAGAAKIEYVGLFEERPTSAMNTVGEPPAPPQRPPVPKMQTGEGVRAPGRVPAPRPGQGPRDKKAPAPAGKKQG